MNFNKLLIILLFTFVCKSTFSQNLNKSQREYFILGTLSDYMGRILDPTEQSLLDRYYGYESPLITIVDSLLKIDYNTSVYKIDKLVGSKGNHRSFKIFSDLLTNKFNDYYSFSPNGTSATVGGAILSGKLKEDIFKTDEEKLAFLAGIYSRFGRTSDTAFEISIANSFSKAQICYHLLSSLKSNPSYQIKLGIPVGYHIYFHPNAKLKAYLQDYMYLRKQLDESQAAISQKMQLQGGNNKTKP